MHQRIRRLAAVWFADIVGYTSLSTKDEDAALAVVDDFQEQSRRAVAGRGRLVKFLGDGALAVFDSTNSALESALALQASFAQSALARQHGCSLSVGLHVGEVVESDDGDVYGDGVNVAARIEHAAGPGQIVFSEDVYRQVRHRTTYHPRAFGEHRLKGLEESLRLFVLSSEPGDRSASGARPPAAPPATAGESPVRSMASGRAEADAAAAGSQPRAAGWQPLQSGTVLRERYVLESMLGRGGFGATYRASDRGRFGAACAVKEFAPASGLHADTAARFEREAQVLATLDHEGIPRLHEYFADNDRCFLVQDLVEGEDLGRVVARRGPLPETEVRSILQQLLGILCYLHERHPPVVHRDIKPANIILTPGGRIRLIDFGAVRDALAVDDAGPASTVFTPGYASLEQLSGLVTPGNDLFGAGATTAFLLIGAPPATLPEFGTARFTLAGRTPAGPAIETFVTELMRGGQSGYSTAASALAELTRLGTSESAVTTVVPPSGRRISARAERPGAAASERRVTRQATPAGRRLLPYGAGALVGAAALAVTLASEPSADPTGPASAAVTSPELAGPTAAAASPPARTAEANGPAQPVEGILLDAVARTATASGLLVEVKHPAAWPIVSVPTDGHLALRDPHTGAVFLAGIDVMPGMDVPARSFVERWTATTAQRYARVRVASADAPVGNAWPFILDVSRSSQQVERGTMLVTPFTQPQENTTLFRWWATLGQTDANAAALRAIAETMEVVGAADAPAR